MPEIPRSSAVPSPLGKSLIATAYACDADGSDLELSDGLQSCGRAGATKKTESSKAAAHPAAFALAGS